MRLTREVLLEAIQELQPACYPLELREYLQEIGVRHLWVLPLSLGAIYAAIEELETAGLVTTSQSPGGPQRGGRPRLKIELTEAA